MRVAEVYCILLMPFKKDKPIQAGSIYRRAWDLDNNQKSAQCDISEIAINEWFIRFELSITYKPTKYTW